MPNLFARAASLLLGEDPEDSGDRDVRLLLEALCYAAADPPPACLLKAASRFARIFELIAPDAPGLVSFAAEFDPMPSEIITPRLADMIARTGTTYTDGVALI